MATNTFLDALEGELKPTTAPDDGNVAYTENAALAFRTTKSAVLDFFSNGGALRSRDENSIIGVFEKAFNEDPLLALKAMFYFRDVRGGQGERRTFRILLDWLAKNHPETVEQNLRLIAEYGRWDDLYTLVGTILEKEVFAIIDIQLAHDLKAERPSLLAKWLKSENTSSKKSRALGRKTRKALDISPRRYRKMLSELRRKIDLVEQHISKNEWGAIEYDKIPSKAGLQYRKAFRRHDEDRYQAFLDAVASGEAKINAGTLYPYEIAEKCTGYGPVSDAATLNAMWDNLPNYFEGNDGVRGLVVADVSGSMAGRPMNVSVSLAVYTAERNTGPFAGKYITFTDKPKLVTVNKESSIVDKIQQVMHTDVGYNTNVEAVFDLILTTAVRSKMSQDDLPTHLYIISDMEFDAAQSGYGWGASRTKPDVDERLFQTIERKFKDAGYKMPFLVFWNVNSRNDQQPMTMDQRGFQLVSGCSPSIFTSLLSNKAVSAYDLMLEVLNNERYAPIQSEGRVYLSNDR